jgi:putative cardiolipin synthase
MGLRFPDNHLAQIAMAMVLTLVLLSGCVSVPVDYPRIESFAYAGTDDTYLGGQIRENLGEQLQQTGVYPLDSGMQAFVARMAVIAVAERSLDLQYYIWHADSSGKLLANQVLQAAERGVRVRLLLDDLDTEGKDAALLQLDSHPNIEVRLYNVFGYRGSRGLGFAGDLRRLNHRMHNKSLTADNLVTIVGGRNIGNEYFDAVAHTTFADLDVLAVGPLVADVSNMFDLYWNSDMVVPVAAFTGQHDLTGEALRAARVRFEATIDQELASPYIRAVYESQILSELQLSRIPFQWGSAQLIYDDPRKMDHEQISEDTHLVPQLAPLFANAENEVVVASPYFVPGDELVQYFAGLEARGVRVRILTNSLAANDVGMVHAGYMRYRKELLRAGVDLYEFKPDPATLKSEKNWMGSSPSSLHAKFMSADGKLVFVGSFNLDPRSVALNTEMGVLFENPALARQMVGAFNEAAVTQAYQVQLDEEGDLVWLEHVDGQTLRYQDEPQTTLWQRAVARFLSWVVPERML